MKPGWQWCAAQWRRIDGTDRTVPGRALAESEADRRSHRAAVTERRLAAEARILDAQADHDEQELRLQAQTELREKKAVSEVDFRSQRIRADRARARVDFERRRFDELQVSLEAERDARDARVACACRSPTRAISRVDRARSPPFSAARSPEASSVWTPR